MARLEDLPDFEQEFLLKMPMPSFESRPWVTGPKLSERKLAIVTTAGLHKHEDKAFSINGADYRVIPVDTKSEELVMSHTSVNYDRSGYQQDINTAFPTDRMRELAEEGVIGSIGSYHYSFMGASNPDDVRANAKELAPIILNDGVDSILLTGV